jgi:hypothetical protein
VTVVCIDIGSTYTTAPRVDVLTCSLLGTAQAPITADVVGGVLAAAGLLATEHPEAAAGLLRGPAA